MTTLTNTQQVQPKWLNYVQHGLAGLLALGFLFFGGTKLMGNEMFLENFARWGYPAWFMYLTGAIEVGSALLLLLPKTRFFGAALLVPTMTGAVLTHVVHSEFGAIPLPLVLLILAAVVAWINRPFGR